MPTRRRIVSLCGPTGGGKSSLAVRLVEELGLDRSSRVPADWYLLAEDADRSGRSGYGWDWPLIAADLEGPDGRWVRTPAFDFTTMRRSEAGTVKQFVLRPVMIVDAMMPFPGADLVVRLDTPAGVRRERLAERNVRWGTTVLDRWEHLERSHEAADAGDADLVLDGRRPLAELAGLVIDAMIRRFDAPWAPDVPVPRRR